MREMKCPPERLLGGGPLRTAFETVALGKAEAPGSVGGPTAGGRLRRLMVECQRDRVEHVLPVALLPPSVLREVDAQRWKPVCHRDRDLRLPGLAVAGDGGPHPLRRVHREGGVLTSGEVLRAARQLMEL